MPNTVYGPYSATAWSDGVTMGNQTRMNNLETSSSVAIHSLNPNLSGPFVLSGISCTKDGTIANQLDIASGVAFITLSDGTIGQVSVVSDNTHTTSTPSTTYYLYLQPDGTWYWSTSNAPAANSLSIAQVATDGSGNISTVTDVRHLAGNSGISLSVARALNVAVTATTDQLFLTYTPPVRGFYQAHFVATYINATPQKPVAYVRYYDPNLATYVTANFMLISSVAAGQILTGSQATSPGNNQGLATMPISFYNEAGQALGVHFQDPGGTPNCHVSAVITRLS